ncbi:fumarylacetoacetate hydrolase family protein [Actinocorallia sp. A-T 12471]|uniref:fumarylacetoacetate hydrolase family protein n=1 Tax=Actinocorallia sp. A-T 12471 TaxID=3089813 RepID=UPI0029D3BE15|nr:fumarylacetoacetate hydrolase family protein [Actinocorallia sp. A-T 12471]MDX6741675.1 fumarylacetoacetate hydrolase family protein [Actinocorallia sp. A-T 12471]
MRWTSYLSPRDHAEHAALLVDGELRALDRTLLDLLRDADPLEAWAERATAAPWERLAADGVALLAPIPTPPSVRDFMAFEDHVVTSYAAMGIPVSPVWYEQPVFYFTNPAAILGPQQDVPMAPGTSRYDYELEVAAVIGKAGADLRPDEAEGHIAGYVIFCDWSARDLQGHEMKAGLGPAKGKDTATSLGPWLVTPDELAPFRKGNGYDLRMSTSVNGREYSVGNWADLYWSFAEMVAYASRGTVLRPGDVLGSGTVGTGCVLELGLTHGERAYPWLRPGDEVRVEIDGLGAIEARIVEGTAPIPLR